jgi:hypothetical protein
MRSIKSRTSSMPRLLAANILSTWPRIGLCSLGGIDSKEFDEIPDFVDDQALEMLFNWNNLRNQPKQGE